MKKITLIILLIIVFIILFKTFPNKTNTTEKVMNKKYTFYKEELKERYKKYSENNPNLSEVEIITRVNLNLDFPFYTNTQKAKNINTNLVLVNKYNYLDQDYIPNNLIKVKNNVSGERFLVEEAVNKFYEMCNAIEKENLQIRIISAYRSYNYQKVLYDTYVSKDGLDKADTYSARPGYSEHQTGLVIDIDNNKTNYENFESTEEFIWMKNNSYKYGYILRYPKDKEEITGYTYEAWHYRYVGVEVAKILHESNLTLDEYIARTN